MWRRVEHPFEMDLLCQRMGTISFTVFTKSSLANGCVSSLQDVWIVQLRIYPIIATMGVIQE